MLARAAFILAALCLLLLAACKDDAPITNEQIAAQMAANPALRREIARRLAAEPEIIRELAAELAANHAEALRGPQGVPGPQGAQGEQGPQGERGLRGEAGDGAGASALYCTRLCAEGATDGSGNQCRGGRWVSARDLCSADQDCPQNDGTPWGVRWACIEGACQRAACEHDGQCGELEVCRPFSVVPDVPLN